METKAKKPMVAAICEAIRKVPRGRVSTYGAIAKAAGYPRCSRHVGRVLKQVGGLPWQRILGSGGRISLRGESAMEQRFLLQSEGIRFKGLRVDLREFEHCFATAGRQRVSVAKGSPRETKGTAFRPSVNAAKSTRPLSGFRRRNQPALNAKRLPPKL
jgi:methylated-DNA-protein-cysteine methyltransferase related protein